MKKACAICKIFGILAIIGTLNWGIIGLTGNNVVEGITGAGTALTKVIYILVGLSGIMLVVKCFKDCGKCKA